MTKKCHNIFDKDISLNETIPNPRQMLINCGLFIQDIETK